MSEIRTLVIPDGLDGERLDAAISRMLGFSRTKAAALIEAGDVLLDDVVTDKATKVSAGALLEITIPAPPAPTEIVAERIPGLTVLFDDADVVVVDKPVGIAAHPSPGWTGQTVIGGLAGLGYRISTSGAAERQGVVHRLDVGTTGVMVVAKSERAYSSLKAQFKERSVDKIYHALVQGHPTSGRWCRAGSRASRTTTRSRRSRMRHCSKSTSKPAARTRSACT